MAEVRVESNRRLVGRDSFDVSCPSRPSSLASCARPQRCARFQVRQGVRLRCNVSVVIMVGDRIRVRVLFARAGWLLHYDPQGPENIYKFSAAPLQRFFAPSLPNTFPNLNFSQSPSMISWSDTLSSRASSLLTYVVKSNIT